MSVRLEFEHEKLGWARRSPSFGGHYKGRERELEHFQPRGRRLVKAVEGDEGQEVLVVGAGAGVHDVVIGESVTFEKAALATAAGFEFEAVVEQR